MIEQFHKALGEADSRESLGRLRADIADDFYLRLCVPASGKRHRIALRAVIFSRVFSVRRPTVVVSVPPLELLDRPDTHGGRKPSSKGSDTFTGIPI